MADRPLSARRLLFRAHLGRPTDHSRFSKADVHPKGVHGYDGWKADIRSSRQNVASAPEVEIPASLKMKMLPVR
jgi:hypothetical protein